MQFMWLYMYIDVVEKGCHFF